MKSHSPTRRTVLVHGLQVTALLPLAPLTRATASRGARADERVLVVLQLTGGNDGLNTVVPLRSDDYYRLRPNIALARGGLHALDDEAGLHPGLSGLAELYAEGRVAIVEGVGHEDPDRSHFRALEIWHTAARGPRVGEVGWLGRLADRFASDAPGTTPALAIEPGGLPLSMRGSEVVPPTLADGERFRLRAGPRGMEHARASLIADRGGRADLAYLRDVGRGTYAMARRLAELADAPNVAPYPQEELAARLRLVAQLVRGDFGARIFHLSLDGFDTHARQLPVHADRLRRVSAALTAFQRDLERDGTARRVTTFVFSEFGRRAAENGSHGTDHGRGAPVFVLGPHVRGGRHGVPPDLGRLEDGDVPPAVDFRRVYAALQDDWLGVPPDFGVDPLPLFA